MKKPDSLRVVEIVRYDPAWKGAFRDEEKALRQILGQELLEIHHIGSTAVPGMKAKPVIDILVVVKDIRMVDSFNERMSTLGYLAMGEYGIKGRRYFTKGGLRRTHHLHVFQEGSPEVERHLRFRDFMIAHPRVAQEYAELKSGLALRFPTDIESYCDGKDAFIKDIDERARAWAKARGSET